MEGDPKADRRDHKLRRRRSLAMVVTNRSIKTVILPLLGRKAEIADKKGDKHGVLGPKASAPKARGDRLSGLPDGARDGLDTEESS